MVGVVIESFGLPNPSVDEFKVLQPNSEEGTAALYGLSMLHTLFNTINTFILLWFIKYIERAVTWIVKMPAKENEELFRLKYISAGPVSTPELAVEQAFDEVIHFAQISQKGFWYAKAAINEADIDKFELLRRKLVKYEEISDRVEYEIAAFLNEVSISEVSESTSMKIKAMYKIIGELESLGDAGEAIGGILSRRNIHNKSFDEETMRKLQYMADAVDDAYNVMIENLKSAHSGSINEISNAYKVEERINNLRNELRDTEMEELENNRKNYQTSVYYMDVVNTLEKMGDFMINVSQDLERAFVNR